MSLINKYMKNHTELHLLTTKRILFFFSVYKEATTLRYFTRRTKNVI